MSLRSLLLAILLAFLASCGSPDVQRDAPTPPRAESADSVSREAMPGADSVDVVSREAAPEESIDTVATEARPWSREGLDVQPRMDRQRQRVPQELGYSPGTTPWRPARLELPAELAGADAPGAATPGDLMLKLASSLGWIGSLGEEVWEATMRIGLEDEDRAVGVVLLWGLKDDAVIGHDFQVDVRRRGDRWTIERVDERYHCSRGVADSGLCI
jgi:hypothetical protein